MLEVEFIDESAQANGDERLLTCAITNLIQNRVNHNSDGYRIQLQISFDERNKTCIFIVADNGREFPC